MPTHIEEELGLGPWVHRLRNRARNALGRLGMRGASKDRRLLDPLTVNYAAWDAVRRHVRTWPTYKEAPNSIEVFVSPEDFEEYWGIDTERKQDNIASYLWQTASKRRLWMSGVPQVKVISDEDLDVGEVDVEVQFLEPVVASDREGQADATHAGPARTARNEGVAAAGAHMAKDEDLRPGAEEADPVRFDEAGASGRACLVGEGGFRLSVSSGDVIGAVREGVDVPDEVNVRLDVCGFPYAEPKHCSVGVIDGRWHVVNHARCGTKLVSSTGTRLMLWVPKPYPLEEGDTIYLGPIRPVRFEIAEASDAPETEGPSDT